MARLQSGFAASVGVAMSAKGWGMKILKTALMAMLLCSASAHAQVAPIVDVKPLGTIKNAFDIQGQFYGTERQHSYSFTLAEAGCVAIGNRSVSKTLKVTLRDRGGGELQNTLMQPQNRRTVPPGGMKLRLMPADYVVLIEHFRRSDTAGIYDITVQREAC
jgi:hypothetical protein